MHARHVVRKKFTDDLWNCATRDDPMTASLPWLTSCSSVVLVCVLELLSATSSWTKTERQEQHDESLHARNRICHVCAAPPSTMSATPAMQNDGRCEFVPRLPRKMTVDVSFATPATQSEGGCEVVPRLPRKGEVVPRLPREIKVDVTKCHACHAEVARRHGRHGGA